MNARRKIAAVLLGAQAALFAVIAAPLNPPPASKASPLSQRAAEAVRRVLAEDATSRIQLLDATQQAGRLTLNFSHDALALVPGSLAFEAWSRGVHFAAAEVLSDEPGDLEIQTLIAGVPLHRLLDATGLPPVARQLAPPTQNAEPKRAALNGRRIALSPGHGYYVNSSNRWVLQRSFFTGIVEDFVNHDLVSLVATQLTAWGADVRPTRHLDRGAGDGESGFPRWQEAARYHVKALGADASVWNETGFTDLEQDIRCRPRYANAIDAELLVSVHNNGGGGTGTETLYDTNHAAAADSKRLADLLHARVIAAIRRDYDPTWADRRVQGFNGSYGENRLATRPAVILEIAFMDRATPDNVALRDDRFKRLVAAAIADGIREFVEGPVPAPPDGLAGAGDFARISLAWVDNATNETGYLVERRAPGSSVWTIVATLPANTTNYSDPTVTAGSTYVYRVQAFNLSGASAQASNEATLSAATTGGSLVLAGVTPVANQVRDWGQDVVFDLLVTDASGRPVPGAEIEVRDSIRNDDAIRPNLTLTDTAGRETFRATIPSGQSNYSYPFSFQAKKPGYAASSPVERGVTVSHDPLTTRTGPRLIGQPTAQIVPLGSRVTFGVITSQSPPAELSYQWQKDGADIVGATMAALALPSVTAAQAGRYSIIVSDVFGMVASLPAPLVVTPRAWLTNLSLRTALEAGRSVIVGFVARGGSKDFLVRAVGPALSAFGLTTAMADPRFELFIGSARVAQNNDWPAALAPTFAGLGAFAFPVASRDAALVQSIEGAATSVVTGTAGGVVLVEGYDAGTGSAVRLVNLSARNRVGTGADAMIAGFVVAGTGTLRVLIRAVGPGLVPFGVTDALADPRLEVRDATGLLAVNDNWDANLAPVFAQAGAFALTPGSPDAALVLTLVAGRSYTAQVSGGGGPTGEALVEVYEAP
ncbi:MAG: N-acetylmuramoyl-L-alanine amidase [Opitutaceae bacterium]